MKVHGTQVIPGTGGSNIPIKGTREPASLMAYRPKEFNAAKKTEEALKKGLDDEDCLYPAEIINQVESGKASLLIWLDNMDRVFNGCGLDTMTRMPLKLHAKGLGPYDKEYNIFQDWGLIDKEDVSIWVQWIINDGDNEDRYNLKMSFEKIQGSISRQMWAKVSSQFRMNGGLPNSGPELLFALIEEHRMTSCSAIQNLVEEIRKMKLHEYPGENVELFGNILWDKISIVIGSAHKPDNIASLMVGCYLSGSVFEFKIMVTELHQRASRKMIPAKDLHSEITIALKNRYLELVDAHVWEPKKHFKEKALALAGAVEADTEPVRNDIHMSTTAALVAQMQQLTQAVAAISNRSGNEVRCHLCNQVGHMKAQCP